MDIIQWNPKQQDKKDWKQNTNNGVSPQDIKLYIVTTIGKTVNVRWTNRQALATVFHELKRALFQN